MSSSGPQDNDSMSESPGHLIRDGEYVISTGRNLTQNYWERSTQFRCRIDCEFSIFTSLMKVLLNYSKFAKLLMSPPNNVPKFRIECH